MKRAIVSMRVDSNNPHAEERDCLDRRWAHWLHSLDVLTFPILNVATHIEKTFSAIAPDILILTGGGDPLPDISGKMSARNQCESRLIALALERNIPIFAVCRGYQFLVQTFLKICPRTITSFDGIRERHVGAIHEVEVIASFLTSETTRRFTVNSFHDYGFLSSDISSPFKIFAESQDGIVEGIFHEDLPIVGLQWHPERPESPSDLDAMILLKLLQNGVFWKGSV